MTPIPDPINPNSDQVKLDRAELALPRLHPAQARIKPALRRFNVLACGRRWGKTTFGIDYLLDDLFDGRPVGWFSPTYKLMLEVWSELLLRLRPSLKRKNISERRIELHTGGVIEFWPVEDGDVARSRKYRRVVVDEAALIPHLQAAWQGGIRPALSDYAGQALFASTPKGLNFFHRLYQRGADPAEQDWAAWREPTINNPLIKPREIEAARQQLPQRVFAQEYEADFLPNEGAVFRGIPAVLTADPNPDPQSHAAHRLVAGLDWGKQHDFTAISIGCAQCRQELARDRYKQLDYAFQRKRIQALAQRWGLSGLLAERNAMGEPNIEQLAREGLPMMPGEDGRLGFATTASSKPRLIENLALIIERADWAFQPDALWEAELVAYGRRVNPFTGRPSYGAPSGAHDDTVMARALMVWAAARQNWLYTG